MKKIFKKTPLYYLYKIYIKLSNKIRYKVRHKEKEQIVKHYQKKYKINTLIETGTYEGDMIKACLNNFKKIYSIELDYNLYNQAYSKFKKYRHITIILGDSSIKIDEILKEVNNQAIFWLDAHYSKGKTARGNKETPIEEELNIIFKHKIKNHIILIDDARCFNGENDYPDLLKLEKLARENKYETTVKGDIVRLIPINL